MVNAFIEASSVKTTERPSSLFACIPSFNAPYVSRTALPLFFFICTIFKTEEPMSMPMTLPDLPFNILLKKPIFIINIIIISNLLN